MPPQQSSPKPHTTATLKALIHKTSQTLSTLPPPLNPSLHIHHHRAIQTHIHHLLHTIQQTLSTHSSTLTRQLATSQASTKAGLSLLHTLTTSHSTRAALRARLFEDSVHQLSKLTDPKHINTTLSFPFITRVKAPTPETIRRRRAFGGCVRSLHTIDLEVHELERRRRDAWAGVVKSRAEVRRVVGLLKRVIRIQGQWGVVLTAVEDVDCALDTMDCGRDGGGGVWLVVCARWGLVKGVVGGVEGEEREVCGVGEVVAEIERVVEELCFNCCVVYL